MAKKRRGRLRHPFQIKRDKKRFVGLLTPCDEQVRTQWAMSMITMIERTYREVPENLGGLYINALGTTILPQGRQKLAELAIEAGCTHLLWIDSDMKFPPDTLLRFLRADEKIIGANYPTRRPPHDPCAQYADRRKVYTRAESSGLEKIHRMGFGLLWTAAEVFREMERPYFNYEHLPNTTDFRGEDYYFFAKAQALGFEAYVDHDLSKEVFHVGAFGYNALMFGEPKEPTQ